MNWFLISIEVVLALLYIVGLVIVLSYYADPDYWKRRVREGGHSRADFERDVQHFEEKDP